MLINGNILFPVMGAVSLTCPNCSTANVIFSPNNSYVMINIDFNPEGTKANYTCKKCQQVNTIYWSKIGS